MKEKPAITQILQSFYKKEEHLCQAKNAKVKNLKRWIAVISDLETFNEFQEVRDRTFGTDICLYVTRQKFLQNQHSIPPTATVKRKIAHVEISDNLTRKRTR